MGILINCFFGALREMKIDPIVSVLWDMKTINIYLLSLLLFAMSVGCSNSKNSNDSDLLKLLLLNQSVSASNSVKYKLLFVTQDGHDGNFGGFAGADAFCNARIPTGVANGKTFKAFLVTSAIGGAGNSRIATVGSDADFNGLGDGQVNWIFSANTEYRRMDGAVVFNTNGRRLFDFMPNNRLENAFSTTGGIQIWTALNPNWTATNSCADWTTNNSLGGNDFGETGLPTGRDLSSIHSGAINCGDTARVLCVEQ